VLADYPFWVNRPSDARWHPLSSVFRRDRRGGRR